MKKIFYQKPSVSESAQLDQIGFVLTQQYELSGGNLQAACANNTYAGAAYSFEINSLAENKDVEIRVTSSNFYAMVVMAVDPEGHLIDCEDDTGSSVVLHFNANATGLYQFSYVDKITGGGGSATFVIKSDNRLSNLQQQVTPPCTADSSCL